MISYSSAKNKKIKVKSRRKERNRLTAVISKVVSNIVDCMFVVHVSLSKIVMLPLGAVCCWLWNVNAGMVWFVQLVLFPR